MKSIRCFVGCLVVFAAVLLAFGNAKAALWDISNYNDGVSLDDAGISTDTGLPYGVTDWFIRYGSKVTNVYNPMWKEWFWYRIGSTDKQYSFSKLPATGVYNADSSAVTLTFTDTHVPARFNATVTFQVTGKPTYSYKSNVKKTITINNLTTAALDYHLFAYTDQDISTGGTTDNAAIVNGDRALQTGFDATSGAPVGRTLVQASTLKPSRYSVDTLSSNPGSILDSLEKGTVPFDISTDPGPNFQNTDMQFALQYDLNIPPNGSVSFDITDDMLETKPMHITMSQAGGSCANYTGNTTYQICVDNLTNTVATNNVVVNTNFAPSDNDSFGKFPFISATNGGIYDPVTKTIGWTFPSMAAGAQQCVQVTIAANTTKAFTAGATIYSNETFPAQASVATPLCNYPPTVSSALPSPAKTGIQYVYQITATDAENDPLTFTLIQAPTGMTMDASGRITWTPTSQQGNLSYPVKVDISDGHSVVHYAFSIYAQWQNQAPIAPAQQTANAVANQLLSYQVSASDPDNQVLTFTTVDTLPAGLTLSAGGLLAGTPTAIGTYNINVTVADSSQAAVTTTLAINVTATAQPQPQTIGTITFNPATINVGGATTVSATATSGLAVAFTSTTPAVCTVSGSTVIVIAGTCTIAANQAGNASYNPATQVTQSITTGKAAQAIGMFAFTPATLNAGGTTTVSATATSGLPVTFSSITPAVCTVGGSTVSAIAAGTCSIAIDQAGNASYSAATRVIQSIPNGTATAVIAHDGRLDGSSQPSVGDVLKVLRHIIGTEILSADGQIHADVAPLNANGQPQGDGRVDMSDAIMILRRSIGIGNW